MKRKIALAMAAVMTFASVLTVPFNVQAASSVTVSNFIDTGLSPRVNGTVLSASPGVTTHSRDAAGNRHLRILGEERIFAPQNHNNAMFTQAAELVITLTNAVSRPAWDAARRTMSFEIALENAEWVFASDGLLNLGNSHEARHADSLSWSAVAHGAANFNTTTHRAWGLPGAGIVTADGNAAQNLVRNNLMENLFHQGDLTFTGATPTSFATFAGWATSGTGTYGASASSIAYNINISYVGASSTIARVEFYVPTGGIPAGSWLRIPVIGRATGGGAITASIRDTGDGVVTNVTGLNLVRGFAGGTANVRNQGGRVTATTNLVSRVNNIIIEEPTRGVMGQDATFILQAPAGFEFAQTVPTNPIPAPGLLNQSSVGNNMAATGTDVVGINLINFGATARVGRVSFASVGYSNAQMINHDNRHWGATINLGGSPVVAQNEGWWWPQADAATLVGENLMRAADRSRLIVVLENLDSQTNLNNQPGVVVISGLTLVPTAETLANFAAFDRTGNFDITVIGSTLNNQHGRRTGVPTGEGVSVPGFTLQGDRGVSVTRSHATNQVNQFAGRSDTTGRGANGNSNRDAGIVVRELSLNAWNLVLPITFTLVDAEGVPLLDQAKITAVGVDRMGNERWNSTFQSLAPDGATTNNDPSWYNNTQSNMAIIGTQRNFGFSPDGTSVSFWGNFRTATAADQLAWQFEQRFNIHISTVPNFSGNVYVEVSGAAVDGLIEGATRVLLHTIQPRIEVETITNTIGIGHQTINLASLTVSEVAAQGLGLANDVVNFSITEFGRPTDRFGFNPISMSNVSATGMIVAVEAHQGARLGIRILSRTPGVNTGSITLNNISVWADRTVPEGIWGLAISNSRPGASGLPALQPIQNNFDTSVLPGAISTWPGWMRASSVETWDAATPNPNALGTPIVRPTADWHNRTRNNSLDSFSTFGFQVERFIVVGTPGQQHHALSTPVSFSIAAGTQNATVNGVVTPIMSHGVARPIVNIDGRVLMPLRALAEFMGARNQDFVFAPTIFQNVIVDTTILTLGGTQVMFFIGTPWYTVDGGAPRMMPNGVETQIIDDVTYVPFRGFGQAFGIAVYFDGMTNTAWFNHPQGLSD
jgi:hypothetical protein